LPEKYRQGHKPFVFVPADRRFLSKIPSRQQRAMVTLENSFTATVMKPARESTLSRAITPEIRQLLEEILAKVSGSRPLSFTQAKTITAGPGHFEFRETMLADITTLARTLCTSAQELPLPLLGGASYLRHVLGCSSCVGALRVQELGLAKAKPQ